MAKQDFSRAELRDDLRDDLLKAIALILARGEKSEAMQIYRKLRRPGIWNFASARAAPRRR